MVRSDVCWKLGYISCGLELEDCMMDYFLQACFPHIYFRHTFLFQVVISAFCGCEFGKLSEVFRRCGILSNYAYSKMVNEEFEPYLGPPSLIEVGYEVKFAFPFCILFL